MTRIGLASGQVIPCLVRMAGESILLIGRDSCGAAEAFRAAGLVPTGMAAAASAAVAIEGDTQAPLARLRGEHPALPLLVLARRTSIADRVRTLDQGADDWLAVPFAGEELAARLRALLRRSTRLRCGDLAIDLVERSATRGGVPLGLKPRELALLAHLARHGERVVGRGELLGAVWGIGFDPGTNSVAVHISRLRDRLDRGFATRLLHTVGNGYMLSARHGSEQPPAPRDLRRRLVVIAQEDVALA